MRRRENESTLGDVPDYHPQPLAEITVPRRSCAECNYYVSHLGWCRLKLQKVDPRDWCMDRIVTVQRFKSFSDLPTVGSRKGRAE